MEPDVGEHPKEPLCFETWLEQLIEALKNDLSEKALTFLKRLGKLCTTDLERWEFLLVLDVLCHAGVPGFKVMEYSIAEAIAAKRICVKGKRLAAFGCSIDTDASPQVVLIFDLDATSQGDPTLLKLLPAEGKVGLSEATRAIEMEFSKRKKSYFLVWRIGRLDDHVGAWRLNVALLRNRPAGQEHVDDTIVLKEYAKNPFGSLTEGLQRFLRNGGSMGSRLRVMDYQGFPLPLIVQVFRFFNGGGSAAHVEQGFASCLSLGLVTFAFCLFGNAHSHLVFQPFQVFTPLLNRDLLEAVRDCARHFMRQRLKLMGEGQSLEELPGPVGAETKEPGKCMGSEESRQTGRRLRYRDCDPERQKHIRAQAEPYLGLFFDSDEDLFDAILNGDIIDNPELGGPCLREDAYGYR
jgi:hypothetical protein